MPHPPRPTGGSRHGVTDDGFTLVEVIIVTVLLGLVMTVLAMTFTAILRTNPLTEGHINDARSTRALSTWLSQDAMSTPAVDVTPPAAWSPPASPLGFDTHPDNPGLCGSNVGTTNLVQMAWQQVDTATRVYAANYRFDPNGGDPKVLRVTCEGPNLGALTVTSTQRFSEGLSSTQDFSTASSYLYPTLTIELSGDSGATVRVEVGSRNP